jgi:hypothetical protein
MARTIWGSHDRFMDVYLKPYPGYYVPSFALMVNDSSLAMALGGIMKDTTGFVDVLTMSSTSAVTD